MHLLIIFVFVYNLFPSVLTFTNVPCTRSYIYNYINKFNILPYNFIFENYSELFKKSYEGENDGN